MKTLQECKNEVTKKYGTTYFDNVMDLYNEAAELYAQQFKDELENITKAHAHRGEVLEIEQQLLKEAREEKAKLIEALERIAKWDLPATGKFWDVEKTQPTSYETEYGSNGARDYIKNIAKEALTSPQ